MTVNIAERSRRKRQNPTAHCPDQCWGHEVNCNHEKKNPAVSSLNFNITYLRYMGRGRGFLLSIPSKLHMKIVGTTYLKIVTGNFRSGSQRYEGLKSRKETGRVFSPFGTLCSSSRSAASASPSPASPVSYPDRVEKRGEAP